MPIDPKTGRPKAGPADPATRRKALDAALDSERKFGQEQAAKDRKKRETAAAAPKKKKNSTTLGGLLDPKNKRERIAGDTGETLSEAVDRGVKMGTEEDKKRR